MFTTWFETFFFYESAQANLQVVRNTVYWDADIIFFPLGPKAGEEVVSPWGCKKRIK